MPKNRAREIADLADEIQSELEDANYTIGGLKDQVADLEGQVKDLQSKIEELEGENEKLATENEELVEKLGEHPHSSVLADMEMK